MDIDFADISDYLARGNPRQRQSYQTLTRHRIMELLAPYDPLLAGTIPLGIDLPDSDLDIICHCRHKERLAALLHQKFSGYERFTCRINDESVVASFRIDGFQVEIFGQDLPSRRQNAWRHMLIEHRILQNRGEDFRRRVIELKRQGYKTEPAFAMLLGLRGDPYGALLELETSAQNLFQKKRP